MTPVRLIAALLLVLAVCAAIGLRVAQDGAEPLPAAPMTAVAPNPYEQQRALVRQAVASHVRELGDAATLGSIALLDEDAELRLSGTPVTDYAAASAPQARAAPHDALPFPSLEEPTTLERLRAAAAAAQAAAKAADAAEAAAKAARQTEADKAAQAWAAYKRLDYPSEEEYAELESSLRWQITKLDGGIASAEFERQQHIRHLVMYR